MSVVSSRIMTRPASRASAAGVSRVSAATEAPPIYLLERCLAIRCEKKANDDDKPTAAAAAAARSSAASTVSSRPPSGLGHLPTWLPWQRAGTSGRSKTPGSAPQPVADGKERDGNSSHSNRSSAAPAAWQYDGGYILFQVRTAKCISGRYT